MLDPAVLDALAAAMAGRLEADTFFDGVGVVAERQVQELGQLSFEDAVADALNSFGMCVTIQLPKSKVDFENLEGPHNMFIMDLEVLKIPFWSVETEPITIEKIVEITQSLLHGWTPETLGGPFVVRQEHRFYQIDDQDGILRCPIGVVNHGGFDYAIPKTLDPVFTQVGPIVTIACGTTAANIIYVLNDPNNRPKPSNGTWYQGALSPDPGTKISARAWRGGDTPSKIVRYTVL